MVGKQVGKPARQLAFDFKVGPGDSESRKPQIPVLLSSSLRVARVWFRGHLEAQGHLQNTIESYLYDLVVLEQRVGTKTLGRINETDIAGFLADATSKATRKRRITSLKAFYGWLIDDLKLLDISPAESFFAQPLEHTLPTTLSPGQSASLLEAAIGDEPWAAPAMWLMMHLGLGRNELLALERHHIDRTPLAGPVIEIRYASLAKRSKERTLQATPEFGVLYNVFLERKNPESVLFPYGPQAVNGMVERVAERAGIERKVTPQILRHTAAVEMAAGGLSVNELLGQLGLANDARNRETVRLYLAAAAEFSQEESQK